MGTAMHSAPDLSQWCDVEKCFHATLDRLGRIDILVNNAGGGSSSPGNASSIEKIEPSAWDRSSTRT